MDRDKFIDCNSAGLDMFKCDKHQLIGRHPSVFSPEFQPDGKESAIESSNRIDAALQGVPQRFKWRHIKCSGEVFDVEVSLNKIKVKGMYIILAILRDSRDILCW